MFVPDLKPYSAKARCLRAVIIVLLVAGSVQSTLRDWFDVGDSREVKFGLGIPLLVLLLAAIAGFLVVQRHDQRVPAARPEAGPTEPD